MGKNGDDIRHKLATLSRARQGAYVFLSGAFAAPPTPESLAILRDEQYLQAATELFGDLAVKPLLQYAEASRNAAELQRQAHQEFMNLFRVPGGQYITPYESVFRDTRDVGGQQVKGLLMGPSAVDVQKWYRIAAVEISAEYKDLPDHVSLELNFLAHVCGKELGFSTAGDDARLTRAWEIERDFLAAHVVSWVAPLRDKLYEKSQHAYFRTVADLLVEFSRRDLTTLENVVGPSTGKTAPDYEAIA